MSHVPFNVRTPGCSTLCCVVIVSQEFLSLFVTKLETESAVKPVIASLFCGYKVQKSKCTDGHEVSAEVEFRMLSLPLTVRWLVLSLQYACI